MTVAELKEELENYDDGQTVRIMSQPNWPFQYSLRGVVSTDDIKSHESEPDEPTEGSKNRDKDGNEIIYLVEGSQKGYGSKAAWDVVW